MIGEYIPDYYQQVRPIAEEVQQTFPLVYRSQYVLCVQNYLAAKLEAFSFS